MSKEEERTKFKRMLRYSIKKHREDRNITQEEAAKAMDITKGTYEKIETGWRGAGRLELIRLMVKYFQSMDDGSGEEPLITILKCNGFDIPLLRTMLLKNEGVKSNRDDKSTKYTPEA